MLGELPEGGADTFELDDHTVGIANKTWSSVICVNVIGANERQENIDDNAFTSGMAKTSLQYAVQAAQELGIVPNPDWKLVADTIPILKLPNGVTRGNRTYNGVPIKQTDVNLLAYPLTIIKDEAAVKKIWPIKNLVTRPKVRPWDDRYWLPFMLAWANRRKPMNGL